MPKSKLNYKYEWDLTLLYKSEKDPRIEKDMQEIERSAAGFAKKYDTERKPYLSDPSALLAALTDYEKLSAKASGKPIMYFYYRQHMDSRDKAATEKIALFSNRLAKAGNLMQFFMISLGRIAKEKQAAFLKSPELRRFRVLLERGAAILRHLAGAHLPHHDPRHGRAQSFPSLPAKSLTRASSTPLTTPSPIDAALPVICAFVWMLPPPSFRSNPIVALA